jgi:threonine synthase
MSREACAGRSPKVPAYADIFASRAAVSYRRSDQMPRRIRAKCAKMNARPDSRTSGGAVSMTPRAWFQCFDGCPGSYPLTQAIYECPRCGGLLDVCHDMDALRTRSASEWKHLFNRRYMRTTWPYGSGVWGKKEWVQPHVENENVVSFYEGGTNLFWADRLGREIGVDDLWIKMCGNSHTGSFKDLGMTVLVSSVMQRIAEGQQVRAIICASTGDTSASLAAYCAAAKLAAVVLLPSRRVSLPQLLQPVANHALVLSLDTDFDGCMAVVRQLAKRDDLYLANSLNSLRIEGQKTISFEIVQQFDWEPVDWVIVPGGNLGNVSAIGKGFAMLLDLGLIERPPRLVCAQAERANPLYQSYRTGFRTFAPVTAGWTAASAIQIGNPVSVHKAIKALTAFHGVVEQASEDELAHAAALADRTGLFADPHTGVAIAALLKLLERGEIRRSDRVVVVSTANGLKFPDWKIAYHRRLLEGVDCRYANPPVEAPASEEAVLEALDARIAGRSSPLTSGTTAIGAS